MTIALRILVSDGAVLATDSAATIMGADASGRQVVYNVYNNANKVFNLYKGLPIGMATWGIGNLGAYSISTLVKDFRRLLKDGDPSRRIDPTSYTIEEVAHKLAQYVYRDHYAPMYAGKQGSVELGLAVVGYSSKSDFAEEWKVAMDGAGCHGPEVTRPAGEMGMQFDGQPELICRICNGVSLNLPGVLMELGLDLQQAQEIDRACRTKLQAPLVVPSMSIQDVIDVADYLVSCTIGYARFMPGPDTVGGPVEIAAITKHEGFKWVKRKHYFSMELNSGKEEWLCSAQTPVTREESSSQ